MISRLLLSPLAGIYAAVTRLRNKAYDLRVLPQSPSSLPVICVGNVTLGGNGKSPFTEYLAAELIERGLAPVILMRGYGGTVSGPHIVKNSDTAAKVGEEALMHWQRFTGEVPVVVSAKRSVGADFIAKRKLGDVILLDDGYQHRRLSRDVNLLLLDISTEKACSQWRDGYLAPLGRLRESLSSALDRADAVVFIKKISSGMKEVAQLAPENYIEKDIPNFVFELRPEHFTDVVSNENYPLNHFADKKVTAITAIAKPQIFLSMIQALGAKLSDSYLSFRDHHIFTEANWKKISEEQLPIITTTKDAVKLKSFTESSGELFTLELKGTLNSADLWDIITPAISRKSKQTEKKPINKD